MQIIELKNLIDSSLSIRKYLIESKYNQMQCTTGSGFGNGLNYEQQFTQRINETREQILESTEKELKQRFEQDLK